MRQQILGLVQAVEPWDQLEALQREDVLRWIGSGADICRTQKPATPPRHLVSYFVVVDSTARRILLVDHIKAQKWLPTGGHVEPGEHPRDTAAREAQEELGLKAEFLVPGPVFVSQTVTVGLTAGHTDVSLWFVIAGDSRAALDYDAGEFKAVRWFDYDEVLQMDIEQFDPHMHRFVGKWMRRGVGLEKV